MTKGKSGANAPDRNRGREQPPGPRLRATYEDRTGTSNSNSKNNYKNARSNIKAPTPAQLPMPAAS